MGRDERRVRRAPGMETIALFGKGGGGKSTVSTNLSYLYAKGGLRVLHVGCDPKRDSTLRLLGARAPLTMVEAGFSDPRQAIIRSPDGIDCVETGGPSPGVGCAGRGVILTMEHFERMGLFRDQRYDVAVFDVLGDLVCGGFASPLAQGFVRKVAIVLSDEPMSLFAANNIARMVCAYAAGGVALAGLIGNCRYEAPAAAATLERFAARLGTRVLAQFASELLVRRAERAGQTVARFAPEAPVTAAFSRLAQELKNLDPSGLPAPTPLGDAALEAFLREEEPANGAAPEDLRAREKPPRRRR